MSEQALLIMVKNPELGHVKTRLAKEIGDDKALEIYRELLRYTFAVTHKLPVKKYVFYSQYIDEFDLFEPNTYTKFIQHGPNLGKRMSNAFEHAFEQGATEAVVIGSDCYELTTELLATAFELLASNDFVIGPAHDGGYYLLGMKTLFSTAFEGKKWSTENVLLDTLIDIKEAGKTYAMLPTLADVDYAADLGDLKNLISDED